MTTRGKECGYYPPTTAENIPDIAGAPAANAIPRDSGSAINATLTAAIKSLFQFLSVLLN